jgi:hypothetical protein
MTNEPDANQLKREADRISRNDARLARRGIDICISWHGQAGAM